jgi:hypothetical protein
MEWDEVFEAVRSLLLDEWSETVIAFQNEEFQAPQDGSPWIYCEVLPVDADTTIFGSTGLRIQSDLGLIACHVFAPTGTGAGAVFGLAARVGKLLQLRTIGPGVETAGRSLGGAASADDEGNWFRVSSSVPIAIHTTT